MLTDIKIKNCKPRAKPFEMGESPAKAKAESKSQNSEALAFGGCAEKYFDDANLAESTKAMRRSIYEWDLKKGFGLHQSTRRSTGYQRYVLVGRFTIFTAHCELQI